MSLKFCPKQSTLKAALAGGTGIVGAMVLGESINSSVDFFGLNISAPVAVGAAIFAGSMISDVAMPLVGRGASSLVPYGEIGTGTVISGASTALILNRVPNAAPGSWVASTLLGGGSYLLADNVTHRMYGDPQENTCSW
jgi:hypothetical protein